MSLCYEILIVSCWECVTAVNFNYILSSSLLTSIKTLFQNVKIRYWVYMK